MHDGELGARRSVGDAVGEGGDDGRSWQRCYKAPAFELLVLVRSCSLPQLSNAVGEGLCLSYFDAHTLNLLSICVVLHHWE